jgi:hypothetical protein
MFFPQLFLHSIKNPFGIRTVDPLVQGNAFRDRCYDFSNIFAEKLGVFCINYTYSYFLRKLIITSVFDKNANFFRKKIVTITSNPVFRTVNIDKLADFSVTTKGERFRGHFLKEDWTPTFLEGVNNPLWQLVAYVHRSCRSCTKLEFLGRTKAILFLQSTN